MRLSVGYQVTLYGGGKREWRAVYGPTIADVKVFTHRGVQYERVGDELYAWFRCDGAGPGMVRTMIATADVPAAILLEARLEV